MIHSLLLKNFKQHENLSIDFQPGLNVLVGANWAGKTSVEKAILFALGGATATGDDSADIWRWDADPKKDEFLVELVIDLPGWGPTLIRRTDKAASAYVVDNPASLAASGITPVNQFIDAAYGMAMKDRLMLQYSEQGEAQDLLGMGNELQRKLETLAQAFVIDNVLDLVGRDVSRWAGALDGLPDWSGIADTESQLAEEDKARACLEETLEQGKKASQQAALAVSFALDAFEQAQSRYAKASCLRGRQEALVRAIEANEVGLAKAKVAQKDFPVGLDDLLEATIADVESAQTQVREFRERWRLALDRESRLLDLKAKLPGLQQAAKEEEEAEAALASLQEDLAKCEGERAYIYPLWQEAKGASERAYRLFKDSACPTCGRDYPDKDSQALEQAMQAANVERDRLFGLFKKVEGDLQRIQPEVTRLRLQVNKGSGHFLASINEQIYDLEGRTEPSAGLASLVDIAVSLLVGKKADQARYASAIQERDKVVQTIKDLSNALDKAMSELGQLQNELEALGEVPTSEDIACYREALDMARQEEVEAVEAERSARDAWHRADASVRQIQRDLAKMLEARTEAEAIMRDKAEAEALRKYLRENRARLSSSIWDSVLAYASSLLSSVTDDWLGMLARRSDGKFTCEEGGKRRPVRALSGAQKSIVTLCIRIAMAKTFYGDGLPLILDEVTDSCDNANSAALAGMIASISTQVIMVTHREGDQVNAGHVIEIGGAHVG